MLDIKTILSLEQLYIVIKQKISNFNITNDITEYNKTLLNDYILNCIIDNNLTKQPRILYIIIECILCYTNRNKLTDIITMFNIFNDSIKFAISINNKKGYINVCNCIELWIHTRHISYFNNKDIFDVFIYLIENKFVDTKSLKRWLLRENFNKYNYKFGFLLNLTDFVLLRSKIYEILEIVYNNYTNYNLYNIQTITTINNIYKQLLLEYKHNNSYLEYDNISSNNSLNPKFLNTTDNKYFNTNNIYSNDSILFLEDKTHLDLDNNNFSSDTLTSTSTSTSTSVTSASLDSSNIDYDNI